MVGSSIIILLMLAIFLGFPIIIGVYVYANAKSRGMNAALWTLIAVLAPAFIGFIIYLLVRGSYSDLKCPTCKTVIKEEFVSCPNCGTRLKPNCPKCSEPVEINWKVCPNCSTPLSDKYENVNPPERKKDKTLSTILIAVSVIPIAFLIVVLLGYMSVKTETSGTVVTSVPTDTYLRKAETTDVKEWLDGIADDTNEAYALRYTYQMEDEIAVDYLIFLPCLEGDAYVSSDHSSVFGNNSIILELLNGKLGTGDTFILVTCTGGSVPDLKVEYEGMDLKCNITEVKYPINLYNSFESKAGIDMVIEDEKILKEE